MAVTHAAGQLEQRIDVAFPGMLFLNVSPAVSSHFTVSLWLCQKITQLRMDIIPLMIETDESHRIFGQSRIPTNLGDK